MNNKIKALYHFASKSDIKPEIACIMLTADKAVATDSYKLIEVSNVLPEPLTTTVYLDARQIKAVVKAKSVLSLEEKTLTVTTNGVAATITQPSNVNSFPEYMRIMPTEQDIGSSVLLNVEHMLEMFTAFKELGLVKVQFGIHKDSLYKPCLVTSQNVKALIMPMTR
jgi:hypothetical protein